jgi:hypothetical protein
MKRLFYSDPTPVLLKTAESLPSRAKHLASKGQRAAINARRIVVSALAQQFTTALTCTSHMGGWYGSFNP